MVSEKKPIKAIKIGNSMGFRMPKKYFDILNIKPGDEFDLNVDLQKAVFDIKKRKKK